MILFLAMLASAAAALVFLEYALALIRARDRIAGVRRTVATRTGPIEYATLGSGPPVLVVHGAGGGCDQGLAFGRRLAARGLRVIAVSRFGYLGTPMPADASAQAQADAHAALLDALGIERAAVVGGSAGAPSAMQLAIRHPGRVAVLVLLVPAAFVPRPGGPGMPAPRATPWFFATALRFDFLWWAACRIARPLLVRAILATPPRVLAAAGRDEQLRVRAILDDVLPVSARRLGLLNDAAITSALPRYELERIEALTLAISVEDDLFGTCAAARYTAEHVPRARFIAYREGGHIFAGHDAAVSERMAAFIEENAGGTSHLDHPGSSGPESESLLQGAGSGIR